MSIELLKKRTKALTFHFAKGTQNHRVGPAFSAPWIPDMAEAMAMWHVLMYYKHLRLSKVEIELG